MTGEARAACPEFARPSPCENGGRGKATLTADELLEHLRRIRRFGAGDIRAPHKPLLLLYALGRLKHGGAREIRYLEAEAVLRPLLHIYGPPGTRARTADPFGRLLADGIWRLNMAAPDRIKMLDRGGNPRPSFLREQDVAAGFSDDVLELLRDQPGLIDVAARLLLDASFPGDLHPDILAAVGLELGPPTTNQRNVRFRRSVLEAYLYCCSTCGFSLRCGDALVGLDAAHIRWHAFGGPSEVTNGVALCSLHHKLFDLGVITIGLDRHLRVAAAVNGLSASRLIEQLDQRPLTLPRDASLHPAPDHVAWHHRQVFRGKYGP